MRVDEQVPERQVHAVSVVAGEREVVLVEHAHEPRLAALVGALRAAFGVSRCEEEHVEALDESLALGGDPVPARLEALVESVGKAARVELIL